MRALRTPLLLLHGERDTVIPASHSEVLARANPAARLLRIAGAGHNDLGAQEEYWRAIGTFLAERAQ